MRTLINRKVGNPSEAVILRTSRNFPSVRVMLIQELGLCLPIRRAAFGLGRVVGAVIFFYFASLRPVLVSVQADFDAIL